VHRNLARARIRSARCAYNGSAMDFAHPPTADTGLVEIVRDFLRAHRELRAIAALHRSGELHFDRVKGLVGDGEEAVLYRLKERCHTLFREEGGAQVGREALLDLAIGALFHEAMKFRENFYQLAVYGPKVRALRASRADGEELFREFEKILADSSVRLAEALHEAEILLQQTAVELQALLRNQSHNGLVARLLVEQGGELAGVFGRDLPQLLGDVFGGVAPGYERAARSYLESGYFGEAAEAFATALAEGSGGAEPSALRDYAEGMQAFLERDYARAVERLRRWLDAGAARDAKLADLAFTALSRVAPLVDDAKSPDIRAAAAKLAERIRPFAPHARSVESLAL
jgi:hypothetical protein